MVAEWLSIQNFQRSQDLLSAINTLSIYTKLELAGISSEEDKATVNLSRETLAKFLGGLDKMVQEAEKKEAILGIDPRQRQLVMNFIAAKQNKRRFHSVLFQNTISYVQELLKSDDEKDRRSLIKCLDELRSIVEDHIQIDTMQILGDI